MNLNPRPFEAIKNGRKTVEMRLNDERRKGIMPGDHIKFTHTKTGEELIVQVIERKAYPSFCELYRAYDKVSIGYNEDEPADPSDMLEYYTEEKINEYGALALKIKII